MDVDVDVESSVYFLVVAWFDDALSGML